MLSLSACDDNKSKDDGSDHNHVYSNDTSINTESEKKMADDVAAAVVPDAPATEPENKPKFNDATMILTMKPSGELCVPVNVTKDNNFTYGVYCDEHGINVWHEGVPEMLLEQVITKEEIKLKW